jgi:hypothetical protein
MTNYNLTSYTNYFNQYLNSYFNEDKDNCNTLYQNKCNNEFNNLLSKYKNATYHLDKKHIISRIIYGNPDLPLLLIEYLQKIKCDVSNDDCNIHNLTETKKDNFIKNLSDINFILYLCNIFEISCDNILGFTYPIVSDEGDGGDDGDEGNENNKITLNMLIEQRKIIDETPQENINQINELQKKYDNDYDTYCKLTESKFDDTKKNIFDNLLNIIHSNNGSKSKFFSTHRMIEKFFNENLKDYITDETKKFNNYFKVKYQNKALNILYIIIGIIVLFMMGYFIYHTMKGDLVSISTYIINFYLKHILLFIELMIIFIYIYYATHPGGGASEIETTMYSDVYYMYILYIILILNALYIVKSNTVSNLYIIFLYFVIVMHILFKLIHVIMFWIFKETYIEIYSHEYYQIIQSFNMQSILILSIIFFVILNIKKQYNVITFSTGGGIESSTEIPYQVYYSIIALFITIIIFVYVLFFKLIYNWFKQKDYLIDNTIISYHNMQIYNVQIIILCISIMVVLYKSGLLSILQDSETLNKIPSQMIQSSSIYKIYKKTSDNLSKIEGKDVATATEKVDKVIINTSNKIANKVSTQLSGLKNKLPKIPSTTDLKNKVDITSVKNKVLDTVKSGPKIIKETKNAIMKL